MGGLFLLYLFLFAGVYWWQVYPHGLSPFWVQTPVCYTVYTITVMTRRKIHPVLHLSTDDASEKSKNKTGWIFHCIQYIRRGALPLWLYEALGLPWICRTFIFSWLIFEASSNAGHCRQLDRFSWFGSLISVLTEIYIWYRLKYEKSI